MVKEHMKQTNVFLYAKYRCYRFFKNEKEQLKVELFIKLEDIQSEMKIFNLFFFLNIQHNIVEESKAIKSP